MAKTSKKTEAVLPKFGIGEQVRLKVDPQDESREVLSFTYDPERACFLYTLTSVEVDASARKLINGVIHCTEDEITLVSEAE